MSVASRPAFQIRTETSQLLGFLPFSSSGGGGRREREEGGAERRCCWIEGGDGNEARDAMMTLEIDEESKSMKSVESLQPGEKRKRSRR